MLECQTLFIHSKDATALQRIVDPDTGVTLGHARWLMSNLEVRELDDEPLLFTVRRRWLFFRRRVLRDADGNVIGFVGGGVIQDRWGRCLATREGGNATSVFQGRMGQEIAILRSGQEGCRLTFGAELEGEPFVKM